MPNRKAILRDLLRNPIGVAVFLLGEPAANGAILDRLDGDNARYLEGVAEGLRVKVAALEAEIVELEAWAADHLERYRATLRDADELRATIARVEADRDRYADEAAALRGKLADLEVDEPLELELRRQVAELAAELAELRKGELDAAAAGRRQAGSPFVCAACYEWPSFCTCPPAKAAETDPIGADVAAFSAASRRQAEALKLADLEAASVRADAIQVELRRRIVQLEQTVKIRDTTAAEAEVRYRAGVRALEEADKRAIGYRFERNGYKAEADRLVAMVKAQADKLEALRLSARAAIHALEAELVTARAAAYSGCACGLAGAACRCM